MHEGKGWNGLVREGKAQLENGKGSERAGNGARDGRKKWERGKVRGLEGGEKRRGREGVMSYKH